MSMILFPIRLTAATARRTAALLSGKWRNITDALTL